MENFRGNCGMTISELNRVSGISRTTIYAYEKGEAIKRETEIELLEAIRRNKKAVGIRAEIGIALKELGVSPCESGNVSNIVTELNSIRCELMQFSSPEGDYDPDFSVLTSKEISELDAVIRSLCSEVTVIKSAHRV